MKLELWSSDHNKLICVINEIKGLSYEANVVVVSTEEEEKFFKFNIMNYNFRII